MLQEFKSIMSSSSDMRCRLETAIRQSQEQKNQQKTGSTSSGGSGAGHAKPSNQNLSRPLQQQPTIKLKTDFTNFTC